jgi:hypothetical protein
MATLGPRQAVAELGQAHQASRTAAGRRTRTGINGPHAPHERHEALVEGDRVNLFRNWIWVGDFLWLTIYYDHRFEELKPTQTKITFALEASGFGKSILGRLFAKIYSKTLDRAIASLVHEMNASRA